ncbi:MAG: retroviral-like aspartic protease family protein, partial [Candidatus Obscuribacterales bacterium]|nr:retroviral-like aspartic protease family protein [Candidatus Obscuribacterales bacterium]
MSLKNKLLILSYLLMPLAALGADDSFSKGVELFNKQAYTEALEKFKQASTPANESKRLYYSALCCLRSAQQSRALALFDEICRKYPGTEAAGFAKSYLNSGKLTNPRLEKTPSFASADDFEPAELAIPFRRTAKGQLTVNAELNGSPMSMLFDTGAEECLIGLNQLERANLTSAKRSRTADLGSVSGSMRIFQVAAPLKLDSLKRTLPICVQDSSMETAILGQPFF